jgi:hypothetical protein
MGAGIVRIVTDASFSRDVRGASRPSCSIGFSGPAI